MSNLFRKKIISNPLEKKLIGSLVEISVGEPWDFESEAGENILFGKILDVLEYDKEKTLICKVTPFFDIDIKKKINSIMVHCRYRDDLATMFEQLLKRKEIM